MALMYKRSEHDQSYMYVDNQWKSYQSIKTMSPLSMGHCAVDQYIWMSRGSRMQLANACGDCVQ